MTHEQIAKEIAKHLKMAAELAKDNEIIVTMSLDDDKVKQLHDHIATMQQKPERTTQQRTEAIR